MATPRRSRGAWLAPRGGLAHQAGAARASSAGLRRTGLRVIDRLTLHIGHMKTGTSSLQATFRDSAAVLAAHGLYYYAAHRNHHPIARRFHRPTRRRSDKPHLDRFVRELRATALPRALVTSETFMRLTDREAADCVAFFQRFARRVDVLLYVRHPVAFASSAAHQGVRSGRPLAECVTAPRVLPLRRTILRWRGVVGPRNLTVRPFAPQLLAGGDVVDDVLAVLGLSAAGPEMTRTQVNEGLSVLAIHLIDRANALAGGKPLPIESMRPFDAIGGPKYVLPRESLERARAAAAPELAFLKEEYGIVLPEPSDEPSPPLDLDAASLDSLARVLFVSTQHAHRLDRALVSRLLGWRSPYARQWDVPPHPLAPLLQRLGITDRLGGRRAAAGSARAAGEWAGDPGED
jgi:hypothetical protein